MSFLTFDVNSDSSEMVATYDFFISHAGADKERYIGPLASALDAKGVKYWLDSSEINWGDSITSKINDGLKNSRFMLLCLSKNFLRRTWPETELGSALAMQNSEGVKKVIPLILDSKELVLHNYPILAGFAYREFSAGVEALSEALAALIEPAAPTVGRLRITAESVYMARRAEISVEPRVSLKWLAERLQTALGVSKEADSGAFSPFMLRWILVDSRAGEAWYSIPRAERRRIHAMVVAESGGTRISYSERDRLVDLGVYDGIVFHLYPIEDDENYPEPDWPAKLLC